MNVNVHEFIKKWQKRRFCLTWDLNVFLVKFKVVSMNFTQWQWELIWLSFVVCLWKFTSSSDKYKVLAKLRKSSIPEIVFRSSPWLCVIKHHRNVKWNDCGFKTNLRYIDRQQRYPSFISPQTSPPLNSEIVLSQSHSTAAAPHASLKLILQFNSFIANVFWIKS